MSKTFSKILTKNFDVSFSSTFLFCRVFGWISLPEVLRKKAVSKSFSKKSTKNPKPTSSRNLFYHVFGRFSMRGVQKHDKKNIKKINLTLVLFRTLTHPPTTGVTDLFFWRPLAGRAVTSTTTAKTLQGSHAKVASTWWRTGKATLLR